MFKKSQLSLAIGAALGVSSFAALNAQAQDPAVADATQLEEVIVTGSRIQRANLVSASPVQQVNAEELKFVGTVRVEDMIRTLPQVYSYSNSTQQNGATGTATLNLRNLGDERTLVLINGRRMPAGSPIQGGIGADINQIPGALIRSVEVLTGGASATYGSDAVAGVINFLMVDDFEGVKLDYQYSGYQHDNDSSRFQNVIKAAGYPAPSGDTSDGEIDDISFIIGTNTADGRGNVTAYATYRKVDAVWQGDRDYSACALADDLSECFGSGTIPDGLITDFDQFFYMVQGNEFVEWDDRTYNYGAQNYFQAPDKRYTLGSFAHYELNKHVEAYSELMYMNDRSVRQVAPSGNFFVTQSLPCGNAFFSDQQFEALCGQYGLTREDEQFTYVGRRSVESGNRQDDLEYDSFRGVFGLRGDINDTWRYDGYFLYSKVNMSDTFKNDLSTPNIAKAQDAVIDPETGDIVCRSVVDGSDPDCVPWNIFETGGVTAEALNYIGLPLYARGETDQTIGSAYVEGNLGDYGIRIPFADNGIDIVLGAEYRKESLEYSPDKGYAEGLGAGQGGPQTPVDGDYSVKEFFTEVSIPIVEGVALMEQVVLDASYRYSDYDYGPDTDTYGFRLGWAFTDSIKARASYQRAVRAPNVQELFLPEGLNLFGMDDDPCTGPLDDDGLSIAGYTYEQCARSGLQPDNWGNYLSNPAGQYNYLQGGNTDLDPETSDTYTVGLVWTPDFLDGFTLTVDYYDIKIDDGIDNIDQEFILTQCIEGNDELCQQVKRSAGGNIWVGSDPDIAGYITSKSDNLASEKMKGIDMEATYQFDIGRWGSMQLNDVLSYVDSFDRQDVNIAPEEDCAGSFGGVCGFPVPDLRNNFRATWTTPWNVTASVQWRYISKVDDLNEIRDLNEVNYFDLGVIWDVTEWGSLRAGVNNITDKRPPIIGADQSDSSIYGAGNTFPGMYDALGRYWFLGATIGF